jgi:2-keto-4-pentenoate hydratase/2-oxohepta-3-ene-1,7-dioic acid hydratase in catechol pathway
MSAVLVRFTEAASKPLRPGLMVGTDIADISANYPSCCTFLAAHIAGVTILSDTTACDLQRVELGKSRIVDWSASKCLDQPSLLGAEIASVERVELERVGVWEDAVA